jgi:hypothetical protein
MRLKSESSAAPFPFAVVQEMNCRATLLICIFAWLGVIPSFLAIFLPQEVDYLGGAL